MQNSIARPYFYASVASAIKHICRVYLVFEGNIGFLKELCFLSFPPNCAVQSCLSGIEEVQ